MGEEETKKTEVKEPVTNGTKSPEKAAATDGENGVKDMEVDKKGDNSGVGGGKADVDVKDSAKAGEEGDLKDEAQGEKEPEVDEEEEGVAEAVDGDAKNGDDTVENDESVEKNDKAEEGEGDGDDEVEGGDGDDEVEGGDGEDEKVEEKDVKDSEEGNEDEEEEGKDGEDTKESEEVKEDKKGKENSKGGKAEEGSKKRSRGKSDGDKSPNRNKKTVVKTPEPKTPSIDRPVRERKSVERLVAIIDKDSSKEIHIEKGRGTPLKEIPNVAYKLSKKRNDETFKILHNILYGRRGKANQIKHNISRFSGFVWHDNEEKQRLKVKEKFDKFVKEKLLEFCDVLDIPVTKATSKKEEIVVKLVDFLVAPHATTDVLLAEQDQGKKRKRSATKSASNSTSSKGSTKSRKKMDVDSEEEEKENGAADKSEDESEDKKNESEDDSEEDTAKEKVSTGKSKETKKKTPSVESSAKAASKKVITPRKPRSQSKGTSRKSSSNHHKSGEADETTPKVFSRKKKSEEPKKEKSPASKKSNTKNKSGKKAVKGKEKPKEDKLKPTDDELRNAICDILKEVDFNTATFTDILKQLAKQFDADLTPRKQAIKLIIQNELTKLADEADDDEDDDGDSDKEEAQPAPKKVKA